MGTPDFSVPVLQALCRNHEVLCVYSRAPKEAGRGQKVVETPVHVFAKEQGIEVRTPKSLKSIEEQEAFKALGADLAIVAAYGLILPQAILDAFPKGCINVHASLLPRWRGAAPIQRSIEAGDDKSGVTIMQMDVGLDTGDMLLKGEVKIDENTTGEVLHDALSEIGAKLLIETLADLENIKPQKQDESLVTYATKLDKAECKLDFAKTAEELERKIRAFSPFPGTYFEYDGERFKVLKVRMVDDNAKAGTIIEGQDKLIIACQKGALEITKIQRQGKKPMDIEELLRGFKFEQGLLIK